MHVGPSSPALIGRHGEFEQLRAALDRARAGDPATVLVGGDAGVGKTRLVAELTAAAAADGALVTGGACVALTGGSLPFAPVAEALRTLEDRLGRDHVRTLLRGRCRALARLLPGLESAARDVPVSEDAAGRMFEATLALLDALSDEQPVVMAIEDLHWADRSTLDLLAFLARKVHAGRILLVGTFRTDELHRRHPLRPVLSELGRAPGVERLDLAPLTDEQVVDLLGELHGRPPPDDLAADIVARADGNPFHVEELLTWSRSEPSERLPPTLRDILVTRVGRLSEPAQAVLRVAAAAGQEVDHQLLEALVDADADRLGAILREALDQQILVADPGGRTLRFRHALLHEAIHDDLLPGERVAAHRDVAATLRARPELARAGPGGAEAEIAHHWDAAHEPARAFPAWLAATRQARAVYAFAEARRHAERALERWDRVDDTLLADAPPRWQVLREAGQAALLGGEPRGAVAHLRTAVDTDEAVPDATRGALLAELSHALWKLGEDEASVEHAERALAAVPDEPPTPELAEVLEWRGRQLMLLARYEAAVATLRPAVEVARTVGARRTEGEALNSLGASLGAAGEVDQGREHLEGALRIAEEGDRPHAVVRAYVNITAILDGAEHLGEGLRLGLEGLAWAEGEGVTGSFVDFLRLNVVDGLRRRGRWEEADAQVTRLGSGAEESTTGLHHALSVGQLRTGQGRFEEADRLLARARRLAAGTLGPQFLAPLAEAEADLALWQNETAAARDAAARLAGLDLREADARLGRVAALTARVAAESHDTDAPADSARSRSLATARLEDARRALAAAPGDSPAARRLTAAIRHAEAELTRITAEPDPAAWATALDAEGDLVQPAREAYLRWRRAEALLATGRGDEAATDLARAHELATGLGAAPLREAVEDLARRGRVAVPGMPPAVGVEALGLTPREHEVLTLVVAGHTNREIGEALFITAKTASVHVSNILRKLDVDGRGEAARVAEHLGLVEA